MSRTGRLASHIISVMSTRNTRTASIFIDESGTKNSKGGFFVIGLIKSYEPARLWRSIRDIRQYHRYNHEIKFANINGTNIRFYFDIIEELGSSPYVARLAGSVYDANTGFNTDVETWKEQARMARRLIVGNVNRNDQAICFLDLVQTPRGETVAARVKDEANSRLEGTPIIEAYDVDSRFHDLVQLSDIIAGAIHYERTQAAGRVDIDDKNPKARACKRLARALDIDSFDDVKHYKTNILTMTGSVESKQDEDM